ncbi:Hypothetical predicted protein [Mytilus galloprovincialis]|uniref:MAM domain-containing protein n=1 Tax=Mytilus galloprovincialis TaxID=29158 RepID=A0A8B6DVB9_MYTGA|nr:Hypothetical predicted protein [Mytilus galloprovincialis]
MYGRNINTIKVFQQNSKHHIELWKKSDDQGNKWYFQSLSLNDIGPYLIKFKAIRGNGHRSEIAIDDIIITNTDCKKGLIKTSQTCHNIDESISLHECSKYYLQLNKTSLEFDPKVDNCSAAYHDVQTSIATLCNDPNSSYICTFDLPKLIRKDQRCFRPNWLSVEYRCEGNVEQRKYFYICVGIY